MKHYVTFRHLARRILRVAGSPLLSLQGHRISRIGGVSSSQHIFLVGIPRAGTTLLASILASHPKVAAFQDETHFFLQRNYQFLDLRDVPNSTVKRFLRESKSKAELYDRLAQVVLESKPGARFVMEKSPGHGQLRAELLDVFPFCRLLYCVRDPRDAYASLQGGVGLPRISVLRYIQLWRSIAGRSLVDDPRVAWIRYEDLVSNPSEVVRNICSFLGVDFFSGLMDPRTQGINAPHYVRRGDHDRVGQVISASSVGSWVHKMNHGEAKVIADGCSDLMARFGY